MSQKVVFIRVRTDSNPGSDRRPVWMNVDQIGRCRPTRSDGIHTGYTFSL